MNKNAKLLIGLACVSLGLTACKDNDYFDINAYDAKIMYAFPVDSVGANQTWAIYGTAKAEVSVNGDYGERYRIAIYKENPLFSNTVTLLSEDSVYSGSTAMLTFTYELATPIVYFAAYDHLNRRVVEAAKVTDGGTVRVNFFGASASARATRATEAEFPDYAKTLDDYLNPTSESIKQFLTNNNPYNGLINTSLVCYDGLSAETMGAYTPFTNNDLYDNHNTLSNLYYTGADAAYIGNGDGKHYRVAANTEVTQTFHINATYGTVNEAVIYVEGILHLNNSCTLNGVTIVVANGGQLVIDGNAVNMSNSGRFVVMQGGRISGSNGAAFNVNNGMPCYNAGNINFAGKLNINGCDFYNNGTIVVNTLENTSKGLITNFGSIIARNNSDAANAYNCTFVNGCLMQYTDHCGIGQITMLKNSRLNVGGYCEFSQSWQDINNIHSPNILMDKSVIKVGTAYVTNTMFQGPTAEGEFAVVKMNAVQAGNGDDIHQSNNCYFDWDISNIYDKNGGRGTCTSEHKYTGSNPANVNQYVKTHITKFVQETTASPQFSVPSSSCTGVGYNGTPTEPVNDIRDNETVPSYRFCFEDNFPSAGDYDFNDCVMTITPSINGKTVTLTISLDAVGASKQIAAALRIKNLHRYQLKSVERSGFSDYAGTYPDYKLIKPTKLFDANNNAISSTVDIVSELGKTLDPNAATPTYYNYNNLGDETVISLFNDAHWVMSGEGTGSNYLALHNYFYNTVAPSLNSPIAKDTPSKTMTLTFEYESWASEDAPQIFNDISNYDLFIVEQYDARVWEVHTYPFKFDQVLGAYAQGSEKLELYARSQSAKYPWAIQVPGSFKYPIEWQSISGAKIRNEDTENYGVSRPAYSQFRFWAANPEDVTYQRWYEVYSSDLVYIK